MSEAGGEDGFREKETVEDDLHACFADFHWVWKSLVAGYQQITPCIHQPPASSVVIVCSRGKWDRRPRVDGVAELLFKNDGIVFK